MTPQASARFPAGPQLASFSDTNWYWNWFYFEMALRADEVFARHRVHRILKAGPDGARGSMARGLNGSSGRFLPIWINPRLRFGRFLPIWRSVEVSKGRGAGSAHRFTHASVNLGVFVNPDRIKTSTLLSSALHISRNRPCNCATVKLVSIAAKSVHEVRTRPRHACGFATGDSWMSPACYPALPSVAPCHPRVVPCRLALSRVAGVVPACCPKTAAGGGDIRTDDRDTKTGGCGMKETSARVAHARTDAESERRIRCPARKKHARSTKSMLDLRKRSDLIGLGLSVATGNAVPPEAAPGRCGRVAAGRKRKQAPGADYTRRAYLRLPTCSPHPVCRSAGSTL